MGLKNIKKKLRKIVELIIIFGLNWMHMAENIFKKAQSY